MKEIRIDAARHQVAGAAGPALQQRAQLGIGRIENLSHAVEAGNRGQREALDLLAGGDGLMLGSRRRNQPERRAAYSWTLVCQLAASGSFR